jgi:uncharacterized membrane protein
MRIVAMAALAAAVVGAAAMAPASAGSMKAHIEKTGRVVRVDSGWRPNSATQGCILKRVWKVDYAGNPYLKKVRVCA